MRLNFKRIINKFNCVTGIHSRDCSDWRKRRAGWDASWCTKLFNPKWNSQWKWTGDYEYYRSYVRPTSGNGSWILWEIFCVWERKEGSLCWSSAGSIWNNGASLLCCNKFRGYIEDIGFEFNTFDPFVDNQMVNKKHHTIGFHVDDIFSSHIESNVNDLSLNGKTQCMVIMGKYRKPA